MLHAVHDKRNAEVKEGRRMWVVMKLEPWKFESTTFPFRLKCDAGKSVGLLPVYNTREDALSDYPNAGLAEIQVADEVEQ